MKLTYEDYLALPDDGKQYELYAEKKDVLTSPLFPGLTIDLRVVLQTSSVKRRARTSHDLARAFAKR